MRWIIGAGVGAVLAAVLLLLWQARRDHSRDGRRAESPGASEDAGSSSRRTTPGAARGRQPKRMTHVPTVDEVGVEGLNQLLGRDLPRRVVGAAAGCYQDEPGKFEKAELRFDLGIEKGVARVSGVELVSSNLGSSRLEECIVRSVAELSWKDPSAPNLRRTLTESISILDMRKIARRRPPDDRDDDPEDGEEDD